MEGHLYSVLLQQSIITSLDITIFLVNDKVSISLMWYLLNEIVDIVRKRDISCGQLSLVPVFNYIMTIDANSRTSNLYVSAAVVLKDVTELKSSNL